jgi:cellulose synthase/poly-beta-1,6-N-acetylglucosamine synthase-like glycosyltransferase
MTAVDIVLLTVGAYACAWAIYLVAMPLVGTLSGQPTMSGKKSENNWPSVAVIVPASDAERVIVSCVRSLQCCNYPIAKVHIYVVADHCNDNTGASAQKAGATVLIREDGPRGKTYAIDWAFAELKSRRVFPDLYVIVDATAKVDPNFIAAMAEQWSLGNHIVSNHTFVSPESQNWYARCLALMFVHRNLQNQARERLGLSAMLGGCGMAFSKHYIDRFRWSLALPKTHGAHPTEDWRHAVRAVGQGYRVAFADDARVATPLRSSLYGSTQQGARWERGRLINAGTYALTLLMRGVWQRNLLKIFAAFDAMQPPVAILASLSVGLAAATLFAASTSSTIMIVAFIPVTFVGTYGLVTVIKGRHEGIPLTTVLWGPIYLVWRCASFALAWAFLDRMHFNGRRPATVTASPRRSKEPL